MGWSDDLPGVGSFATNMATGGIQGPLAKKAGLGGLGGDLASGNFAGVGSDISNAFGNKKGKDAAAAQQQSIQEQQGAEKGVLATMKGQNADYLSKQQGIGGAYKDATGANVGQYVGRNQGLQAQFDPAYQQMTDTALGNAKGAMTLQQAQDPNNATAQATRNMFNTQAQGVQSQGIADSGVLTALGTQATNNAIGGAGQPITGGMAEAMQNANLGQAGAAYGQAANNANNLRQQGVTAGMNQSNWAYGQGQQAQGAAQNAVANQYGFNQGINQENLGAQQGQAATNYGIDTGMAGLGQQINQSNNNADMGMINQTYGAQQQADIAQAQAGNAQTQGLYGALGTLAGGALGFATGGAGGAAAGGAGGAAAPSQMQNTATGAGLGGQLGGALGGMQTAPTTPGPNYGGGYNPGGSFGAGSPYGNPYGRAA